jgi:hypothetical protein
MHLKSLAMIRDGPGQKSAASFDAWSTIKNGPSVA